MRMSEVYVENNNLFKIQRSVEVEFAGQKRGQAVSHRGNARGIVALLNRATDRARHAI